MFPRKFDVNIPLVKWFHCVGIFNTNVYHDEITAITSTITIPIHRMSTTNEFWQSSTVTDDFANKNAMQTNIVSIW